MRIVCKGSRKSSLLNYTAVLQFDSSVANYVLSRCANLKSGARPVLGIIKKDIVSVIAKSFVNGKYKKNDQGSVFYDGKQVVVSPI
jgi:ATP-dependent Clp protease ATP-binding subunit ClpA